MSQVLVLVLASLVIVLALVLVGLVLVLACPVLVNITDEGWGYGRPFQPARHPGDASGKLRHWIGPLARYCVPGP